MPHRTADTIWTFTLILDGISDLNDAVTDALFEAGCDDALVGVRDGVAFADFDREAPTFQVAVLSAMRQVESAGIGAKVVRIEPDELVTMAEIARRTHRSRESIHQLVNAQRGPGGFPPPVANLSRKSPIWRWHDVALWMQQLGSKGAATEFTSGNGSKESLTAVLNALLEVRRHIPDRAMAHELFQDIMTVEATKPKGRDPQRRKTTSSK